MSKQFSQACENNKSPILGVLQQRLSKGDKLLEIGSGTGQHGVYFSGIFPTIHWQCSDLIENHASIIAWQAESGLDNFLAPIALNSDDFTDARSWQNRAQKLGLCCPYQVVFSANTAHIMSWPQAQKMIALAAASLAKDGLFILYGPFNYQGQFTSDSNARFNDWLVSQAPHRAIRDFEGVVECAQNNGLSLLHDYPMPANNRCLVFVKTSGEHVT